MFTCPHCGKSGIPSFRRIFGSVRPITCKLCSKQSIGSNWSWFFLIVPIILINSIPLIAPTIFQAQAKTFELTFVISIIVGIISNSIFVPLTKM
jgi:hypothetical protein